MALEDLEFLIFLKNVYDLDNNDDKRKSYYFYACGFCLKTSLEYILKTNTISSVMFRDLIIEGISVNCVTIKDSVYCAELLNDYGASDSDFFLTEEGQAIAFGSLKLFRKYFFVGNWDPSWLMVLTSKKDMVFMMLRYRNRFNLFRKIPTELFRLLHSFYI